jgi:hypothetical protein
MSIALIVRRSTPSGYVVTGFDDIPRRNRSLTVRQDAGHHG